MAVAVVSTAAVKGLLLALWCAMVANLIFVFSIGGCFFRTDNFTPWFIATTVDIFIIVVPFAIWITYKESNPITATIWIVLSLCLGSFITCPYILIQFLKLPPQESCQDPLYHVLLRPENNDGVEQNRKHSTNVVTARIIFSVLGCLMLGFSVYTLITDGSPFRKEVFTPWLNATIIDIYILLVTFSVWVADKESSWTSASLWIVFVICFGSLGTCSYIVRQLFQLTSHDPLHLVLIKEDDRYERTYVVEQQDSWS